MINRAGYNRHGWAQGEHAADPAPRDFQGGRRIFQNTKNMQSHELNLRHPNPHHYSNLGDNHAKDHGGEMYQQSLSRPAQDYQPAPGLRQSQDATDSAIQEKADELNRLKQMLLDREKEINQLRAATADQEGYGGYGNPQPAAADPYQGRPQSYSQSQQPGPSYGNPYQYQPQNQSYAAQPQDKTYANQPLDNRYGAQPQDNPYSSQAYGAQPADNPYSSQAYGGQQLPPAQYPPAQYNEPQPPDNLYAQQAYGQPPSNNQPKYEPYVRAVGNPRGEEQPVASNYEAQQASYPQEQRAPQQYLQQGSYQQPPTEVPQAAYNQPMSGYAQQDPYAQQAPPEQPRAEQPTNIEPSPQQNDNQMTAQQYAEYQERLSKAEFDRYHQQSKSQELVNNLQEMDRMHERAKSQVKLRQEQELQQRLEHLRQLEEEDRIAKEKRAEEQRRYKEHLDMQERSRMEIQQKEDMVEQRSLNRKEMDLHQHQPGGFNPGNHLYMYGPNGGTQNQVMFTKKLPKTLWFNPITGHMKDTTVYHPTAMAPEEAKNVTSSLVGPTKLQNNFVAPYAAHAAFQQPKFTKHNPKVQFHNPITGQVGRPIEYLQGDMDTTSYSLDFGKRMIPPSQLQEYGNMAVRNN